MTAAALAVAVVAAAAGLTRTVGGTEVDFHEGTITARAGAAADIRLPSPEVARLGAERRARAAALGKLRAALERLPLSGASRLTEPSVEAAVARAHTRAIEYQSNGGVVLTLGLRFSEVRGDPRDAPAPALTVAVSAMPLELAPRIVVGAEEVALGWAVYRQGSPPVEAKALVARREPDGRLRIEEGATGAGRLAGAGVVIYVRRVLR